MHIAFINPRSQAALKAPAVTVEVHLTSVLPGQLGGTVRIGLTGNS